MIIWFAQFSLSRARCLPLVSCVSPLWFWKRNMRYTEFSFQLSCNSRPGCRNLFYACPFESVGVSFCRNEPNLSEKSWLIVSQVILSSSHKKELWSLNVFLLVGELIPSSPLSASSDKSPHFFWQNHFT